MGFQVGTRAKLGFGVGNGFRVTVDLEVRLEYEAKGLHWSYDLVWGLG